MTVCFYAITPPSVAHSFINFTVVAKMSLKERLHDKIISGIQKLKAQVKPGQLPWKVLILDDFSKRLMSTCCKMHELTSTGITLVEDLNKKREPLPKLEAIYLISPTEQSVSALIADFQNAPNVLYKAAHVYFLQACQDDLFNLLCKAKCAKYIQTLQEINASFLPYESQVFSLDSPETFQYTYNANISSGKKDDREKCAEQIATLCATLGEYPAIRYRGSNDLNGTFAKMVQKKIDAYKADEPTMGEGPQKDRSMLLILDRSFDPVSPLLHELTFQAMAYDVLPIERDVYRYESGDGGAEKETILDEYDELWSDLRHHHIALVSQQVVKKLKEFAEDNHLKTADKTSVRDLNQMLKKAPEHQKKLSMYSAHFHLAEDCMRQYKGYLDKLCEVEQNLVMGTDGTGERIRDHMKLIVPILLNEEMSVRDKIRVIMLYIIHKGGISEENLDKLIQHARIPVEDKCIFTNASRLGLNVISDDGKRKSNQQYLPPTRKERLNEESYTTSRWVPYIRDILEDAIEDKLDPKDFPVQSTGMSGKSTGTAARSARQGQDKRQSYKTGPRLIVFILGGVTYSEMRCAYSVTQEAMHWEIIVGGTHILTPGGFLENLRQLSSAESIPNNETSENGDIALQSLN